MGLSNLPPGVTQGMIDRHFSGPCVDCEVGHHRLCSMCSTTQTRRAYCVPISAPNWPPLSRGSTLSRRPPERRWRHE